MREPSYNPYQELAALLEELADCHEQEEFDGLSESEPQYWAQCLTEAEFANPNVRIALHLWDAWLDANEGRWQYYKYMAKDDWASAAREVAAHVRSGEPIKNPQVLAEFVDGWTTRAA